MAFRIQDFITNLDQQGMTAHANHFDCSMSLPYALYVASNFTSQQLQMVCEASELPGIDIQSLDYRHYGFTKHLPQHINYAPLSLTFYCTAQMQEKLLFDTWMAQCVDVNSGLVTYRLDSSGNPQYETDITVNQYDPAGDLIYSVKVLEAFPISVSALNTNWSDDSVHRLNVQFLYTKWLNMLQQGQTNSGLPPANSPSNPGVSNYTN